MPYLRLAYFNTVTSPLDGSNVVRINSTHPIDVDDVLNAIWDEHRAALQARWPRIDQRWLQLVHLLEPVPDGEAGVLEAAMRNYDDVNKKPLTRNYSLDNVLQPPTNHVAFELRIHDARFESESPPGHIVAAAHSRAVVSAFESETPNSVATNASVYRDQQDKHPIYNGRPLDCTGPPLSIYVPAFARLKAKLQDIDSIQLSSGLPFNLLAKTREFSLAACAVYTNEREREEATFPLLERLLGVDIKRHAAVQHPQKGTDWYEVDGIVETEVEGVDPALSAVLLAIELTNELGMSGASGVQVAAGYRKWITSSQYTDIRALTCCPAVLVVLAGSHVRFYGAIIVDVYIVQPFTDFIDLSGDPDQEKRVEYFARIIQSVREALSELRQYYHSPHPVPTSLPTHILPSPTCASALDVQQLQLHFLDRFDYPGRCKQGADGQDVAENCQRSLFLAKLGPSDSDPKVLVKFCYRYGERVHRLLAEQDPPLAPKLHHCVSLLGGLIMVAMDIVPGGAHAIAAIQYRDAELPEEVMADVLRALDVMSQSNFVHGDVRRPNIAVVKREDGQKGAMLLDFDWAGDQGQVRYPALLNQSDEIVWASGVDAGAPIYMQHDWDMAKKLQLQHA